MKIAPPGIARILLKIVGWTSAGKPEGLKKYIFIASPHTSNWYGFYMLLIGAATDMNIHFIAKVSLFKPPFGWILKKIGGIPVDRSKSQNFTKQIADIFAARDELVIGIAPEGTRSKKDHWRTGFYYMALEAKVPIVLGFLDYKNKRGGFGPVLHPTGDIDSDFEKIKDFYKDIVGKRPENQNVLTLKK